MPHLLNGCAAPRDRQTSWRNVASKATALHIRRVVPKGHGSLTRALPAMGSVRCLWLMRRVQQSAFDWCLEKTLKRGLDRNHCKTVHIHITAQRCQQRDEAIGDVGQAKRSGFRTLAAKVASRNGCGLHLTANAATSFTASATKLVARMAQTSRIDMISRRARGDSPCRRLLTATSFDDKRW